MLLAAVVFVVFCGAAWYSARVGVSRLLSETATRLRGTEYEGEASRLAAKAEGFSPSDPEAHHARAVATAQKGEDAEAVRELEHAAALRPRYFQTWLRLGRARERAGDVDGAVSALRESIRLAPFYAEPRWQLGNTLLRAAKLEEAFAELRLAAASRPSLFPYTVELAWRAYEGDWRAVERAAAPSDDAARVALARFFVKRGLAREAAAQLRSSRGGVGAEERRALVGELIQAGQFREAREVWEGGAEGSGGEGSGEGELLDGGFEDKAALEGPGFGWRFGRGVQGVLVSLDVTGPRTGALSLRFQFEGTPDASALLATQLVTVEQGSRYLLRFAARAEEFVSGGPLVVNVLEAGAGQQPLAQSKQLPIGTRGWEDYEVEFVAPKATSAVLVVIRRQPCAQAQCPAFGRVWFDDFMLKKFP
jgi:tetratricopeptide (TPR) repeat protein